MDLFDYFDVDKDLMIKKTLAEGRVYEGYSGQIYVTRSFNNFNITLSCDRNAEGVLTVKEINTHINGSTVYKMIMYGEPTEYAGNSNSRRCEFAGIDDKPALVPEFINSGVIPSYRNGDIVRAQVSMIATSAIYAKTEDELKEYAKNDTYHSGLVLQAKKYLSHDLPDNLMWFSGRISQIYYGDIENNSQSNPLYYLFILETDDGTLPVCCSKSVIEKGNLTNYTVGSYLYGLGVLSADAAIYEYEKSPLITDESIFRGLLEAAFTDNLCSCRHFLSPKVKMKLIFKRGNMNISGIDDVEKSLPLMKAFGDYSEVVYSSDNSAYLMGDKGEGGITVTIKKNKITEIIVREA